MGRRNRPFYRVAVMDVKTPRDGRAIEELGFYDPLEADRTKAVQLKEDRIRYWLGMGAQTSPTVRDMLKKRGITAKPANVTQTDAHAD